MISARLETSTGHFVVAAEIPPFRTLPGVLLWGSRVFVLYEAGVGDRPSRYREGFSVAVVQTSDVDPLPAIEPKGDG